MSGVAHIDEIIERLPELRGATTDSELSALPTPTTRVETEGQAYVVRVSAKR